MLKRTALTILALAISLQAYCFGDRQDDYAPHRKRRMNLRTEWGIAAGIHYAGLKLSGGENLSLKSRLGFDAGVHMALRFGDAIALQPELLYSYTSADLSVKGIKGSTRIKSHAIEIPLIISVRILSPLHINVGPVFNVMNNTSYIDRNGDKQMFGNLRPTFGYTAGIAVFPLRKLMIDARFTGIFKNTLHNFDGKEFHLGSYIVGLKIGYLF
ncbi:MAG: PorT family protein [Alistipes sp.]|nr:PorT family protein [Alistipes sp.]